VSNCDETGETTILQVVRTAKMTEDVGDPFVGDSTRLRNSKKKGKLSVYIDARTIFVLLA
jgi:hypothetical protein